MGDRDPWWPIDLTEAGTPPWGTSWGANVHLPTGTAHIAGFGDNRFSVAHPTLTSNITRPPVRMYRANSLLELRALLIELAYPEGNND
jgi:hypothetical protein